MNNIHEWHVIFVPPSLDSPLTVFGHVLLAGYAPDATMNTWIFFDPAWRGAQVQVLYRYDEVNEALASFYSRGEAYRIKAGRKIAPIWPMMNCATIVAHMVGYRAFTPWGLKRQLMQNGAERIW